MSDNKFIKLSIRKNSRNNQFNLTPKKTDMSADCLKKMDLSKFLKIKVEDLYFE